jgi:2'-5' RNA ligase
VTIYVGANHSDATEKALSKAAGECQPINLKALEVDHSDEFIKTLFVQFAPNRKLRQLDAIIRSAPQDCSHYELKPHLSLLYKNMLTQSRAVLARSITVPFSEVIFDSLKAIRCVSPTQSRGDVQAWRVVGATELSG